MTARLLAAALLSAVVLAACHRSGTWVDDPKNYQRAWGQDPPGDVQIQHSWYWRSPHFTREEAYYFQFARHDELLRGFIAANDFRPVANAASVTLSNYECFPPPEWFAPNPIATYNVWVTPKGPAAVILEDRKTGGFFVSACQL